MGESFAAYCERSDLDALLRQWDTERNTPLTPEAISHGSGKKVWWRCERGHTWQARIGSRANGAGCPVCDGKRTAPGENDLVTLFPQIAAEWHPEKNDRWTPQDVTPFSNRRAWWQCARGHDYQAIVAHRTMDGAGCPYCTGRRAWPGFNDLATVEPEVAAEWHPTLNGDLHPEQVTAGSHKKVWWSCAVGHTWRAVVYSRTGEQRAGCPLCAGRGRAKFRHHGETDSRQTRNRHQ